ncbi:MAG: type II toxin-antitoxin system HipA family toxin [Deltaproteobacteria bacterium]|nr:type II toxin-antitoxin system HipA family toxin [Deltaproteobacteria bacterium]
MQSLTVFLNERRTGLLWQEGDGLAFRYDADYLETSSPLPLSRHLPLPLEEPEKTFSDRETRAFFENLLPEGEVRAQLARALGISRGNTFAFLSAIGGDCAGAVSVMSQDQPLLADGGRRPISDEELAERLDNLPAHPFLADEEGVRLSLAGAQNKLPVCFDGRGFSIPIGRVPSTHILKTSIPNLEDTVVNEAFCMTLARRLGLQAPAAEVVALAGRRYFLVERYDRYSDAAGIQRRLHQEDFCQALGIPPDQKYEKEGGPGLKACFALVREWSSEPLPDAAALLDWTLFNFLIGNADAHGKNIAFLYRPEGVRLAPFYDLISTAVYERVNNKFAMRFGGEKDPRYLLPVHLERFAGEIGVGLRFAKRRLQTLGAEISRQAVALADEYRHNLSNPVIIGRLLDVIDQRTGKARLLL